MKKIYITFVAIFIFFSIFLIYIFQDSQNKLTLKIKSSMPKEARFFFKDALNSYLYNFDIKLKFVKNYQIKSSNNQTYELNEYNNKFLDYQGPRSYLGLKDDNLFLVTGTGLLAFTKIDNLIKKKNFKLNVIKSNIKDLVSYRNFYVNSSYGTKGLLVDGNSIFLSLSNEIKKNCYNISVLKSEINLKYLNFSYIFKPDQCVKNINKYGEFQPIQSGGVMTKFNDDNILLTTGEFRYRDLAQSDQSIFGKILLVNKSNENYKIVSKGHRNPQGIHFDRLNNVIVSTEHGPLGGDEVNINKNIYDNNNYGWPISSYGEHYPKMAPKYVYIKAPLYKSHSKYGFIEPIKYFVPSIGISQILKVKDGFGDFNNQNYFFSSLGYKDRLNALSIHQIVFNKKYDKIIYEDKIKINHRIRDIIYAPKEKIIIGYLEKKGSLIILSKNE